MRFQSLFVKKIDIKRGGLSFLFNLVLRIMSMGGRFLLLFFIGKYLTLKEIGDYGIILTTITFLIFFIGFDFYIFSNRQISKKLIDLKTSFLNKTLFYITTFGIATIILFVLTYTNIINKSYAFILLAILFFEHFSQEIYRDLIYIKKLEQANFILFLKSGAWSYIICLYWLLSKKPDIFDLLVFWLIFSFLAFAIGFYLLKAHFKGKLFDTVINIDWIIKGLKQSKFFFISTIFLKVIELSDRYMIDFFVSRKEVGLYTLVSGMSNIVTALVVSTIVMKAYPIILDQKEKPQKSYIQQVKNRVFYLSLFISFLILSLTPFVFYYMNKTYSFETGITMFFLISGNIVFNLHLMDHYSLIANNKENEIMKITAKAAFLNLILNMILIQFFKSPGAAFSTFMAYIFLYYKKTELLKEKKQ